MKPDERLTTADDDARRAALDVSRSFIVQAPAGSGKTELLIQRYLSLLSIVDQPEEVLAITFTRKAAFEMQKRVVNAMQEALSGREARQPHHRATLEAARRALARDGAKGWRLAESPHRLRIQTIDALNAAIARSLPVSSGLGATLDVASDEVARSLYRAAAAATLDWLAPGGPNGDAVESLLVHLDNRSSLYIDHIAAMLETRDQWLGLTGTGRDRPFDEPAVRDRLEKTIAGQIAEQLRKVTALSPAGFFDDAVRLAGGTADGRPGPPGTTAAELGAWRGIADALLTRSGTWRKTVTASTGFPPGRAAQKREMLEVLEALAGHETLAAELHRVRSLPEPRYADEQWAVLVALIRLLPLAVAELRRLFAERRICDYVEVAIAAHAALGSMDDPGDVALLLDYSIAHLLIDEMQDTSIAQYELVEKLVAGWQEGDGRTLFCVGDPMQSIYRFRNAEVGEFLLARKRGVGGVRMDALLLRRNFRSGEHLVHWFNDVFARVFPSADDVATGAIAYAASAPADTLRDAGAVRIHPVYGGSEDEEAECGVRVIRDVLRDAGDRSVAVLVRSRTQLKPLLARLRGARIDYQALDIDRLTDLPEIADLLALTRALCHRGDRTAWLALLRAPWVGLTWADLHALAANDTRRTVADLMRDPSRTGALSADGARRVGALLQELGPWLTGHGTRTLQETVERLWYRLGGPALLAHPGQADTVYRFLDILGRLETAGTLADVAELEARLDQELVPARTGAGTRLQIMTMHKAKGLQFDHVVLYALGRRPMHGNRPVLSFMRVPGRRGGQEILISPIGPRADAGADPLHDLIERKLREKDRLEQDRLLYVACTRARDTLHLVGHVPLSDGGAGFAEPLAGSLLRRLWPAVRDVFATEFRARSAAPAGPRAALRDPVLERLVPFMPRPALPPLPPLTAAVPARQPPERAVDYRWAGSAVRHAGNLAHRCLQQLASGRLTEDAVRSEAFKAFARQRAAELGVPAAAVETVCERAREAVRRVLEDETGRWVLFGPGHTELGLTGVHEGALRSVFIDRVRYTDDGAHWIIDYKSGTHEGGSLDAFLDQEVERYRPQLAVYAALYGKLAGVRARTALYFPMLRRFVEVPAPPGPG